MCVERVVEKLWQLAQAISDESATSVRVHGVEVVEGTAMRRPYPNVPADTSEIGINDLGLFEVQECHGLYLRNAVV